jgi:hypothetical protein
MFSQLVQGFDGQVLHGLVQQPSSLIVPALILIGITIWWSSLFNRRKLSVPFFGDEGGNVARAQQRWMTDSMNLLREGFSKVLEPADKFMLDNVHG